jgi:DNA-binding PadR family transcriptional regulator
MKDNNGRLKDRILLSLDSNPSHGYDLLKTLERDDQTIMITTLYRWLHQMELSGLVESEMQPSPYGPPRRVYRVGNEGGSRLREMIRSAIEVITHFYEKYIHYSIACTCKLIPKDSSLFDGTVLFASPDRLNGFELELLCTLARKCNGSKIHILGDKAPFTNQNIPCRLVKGDIMEIKSRKERYKLVWLNGTPETSVLPLALEEIRRVLKEDGTLIITSPLTFFDEPQEPSLGSFLRYTSLNLFPESGVRDGNHISNVIDAFFPDTCVHEVFPEFAMFKATKKKKQS